MPHASPACTRGTAAAAPPPPPPRQSCYQGGECDDRGVGHVMTQVGHSSAAVMTEGGSRDDPGGSRAITCDDPTVTEGGGYWDYRAADMSRR